MRSTWSARPGRRVDVDLQRVEDDRALPHLEPRRQRVDEPRQHGRRVEPDHAPHGPGHAEVGLVRRAARAGSARRPSPRACACPTTTLTRPSRYSPSAFFSEVSSQWKSTIRTGGSGSRRLVEQRVRVGERVLDRLHVGAALQVDHREVACRRARGRCPSPDRAPRACRSCAAAGRDRSTRDTGRSRACPRCGCPT